MSLSFRKARQLVEDGEGGARDEKRRRRRKARAVVRDALAHGDFERDLRVPLQPYNVA